MNNINIRVLFVFFILAFISINQSFAQKGKKGMEKDSIPSTDITFGEEEEEEEEEKPKKKIKKKVFYGIKTKRSFIRYGKGKRQTLEMFYFLKKDLEPNPYIKSIHILDLKKRRIVEVSSLEDVDKTKTPYKILHGPYKKLVGGEVVEEGIFYVGMKHGRWEKYGKDFALTDKTKYKKGLLKESKVTYYDPAKTKMKEVIPMRYEQLHGDYYHFKENGEVLIYGKYIDGQKVGIWIEYFPDRNRKRKEMQYPRNPYVEQFEPFVLNEWDDKGNPLIRNGQPFYDPKKGKKIRR
ncbi:MAG: toxin-antitoxin system YwqK family antitoxin [Cytophagaceae bacterium]